MPQQQISASISIQSLYRGHKDRKMLEEARKWTEQFDSTTGSEYYLNSETSDFKWKKHDDYLTGVINERSARAVKIQSAFRARKARDRAKQLAAEEKVEAKLKKKLQHVYKPSVLEGLTVNRPSQWCKYFDPRSRKVYYRHTGTDIITWEKPAECVMLPSDGSKRDLAALSIQCAVRKRIAANDVAKKRMNLRALTDSKSIEFKLRQLKQVLAEVQSKIDARTPVSTAEEQQFPHLVILITEWKNTLQSIKKHTVLLESRGSHVLLAECVATRIARAEYCHRAFAEMRSECLTLLRGILLMNSYFLDLDVARINAACTTFASWKDSCLLTIAHDNGIRQLFQHAETLFRQSMGSTEFNNGSTSPAGKCYEDWHPSVAAALAAFHEVEQALSKKTHLLGGYQATEVNKTESLRMSEEDLLAYRLAQRQRHSIVGDYLLTECQKFWQKGLDLRNKEVQVAALSEDVKVKRCLNREIDSHSHLSGELDLSNLSIWEATKEGYPVEVIAIVVAAEKQRARRCGNDFVIQVARSNFGETLIGIACWWGHEHLVRYFLEEGALIDGIDSLYNRSSLLHDAARRGHARVIRILLEHGLPINVTDSAGDTPFHWAARRNNFDAVIALLEAKSSQRDKVHAEEVVKTVRQKNYRGKLASSIAKGDRVRNQLKLAEEGRHPLLRCSISIQKVCVTSNNLRAT